MYPIKAKKLINNFTLSCIYFVDHEFVLYCNYVVHYLVRISQLLGEVQQPILYLNISKAILSITSFLKFKNI